MPSSLFPVLSTKRLLLRSLQPTDDTALFALRSNEEVNKYLDRAMPDRIEDVGEFIRKIIRQTERGICWYWVLTLRPGEQVVGSICLWNLSDDKKKAELGFELDPAFQKQGLMQECVLEIAAFAFGPAGLEVLEAYTHCRNEASIKLLEKSGFERASTDAEKGSSAEYVFRLNRKEKNPDTPFV